MKKRILLVRIDRLKSHESVRKSHVKKLKDKVLHDDVFTSAIVVDEQTGVILDGHHRFRVAKELGFRKIPCLCVDYLMDKSIQVLPRGTIYVTKEKVLGRALNNAVFPYKTTKHLIDGIPTSEIKININLPLEALY